MEGRLKFEESKPKTKVNSDPFEVFPGVGKRLLDFLIQQKFKDRDVSLCPRCNVVFDAEVAAIFERESMKKNSLLINKSKFGKGMHLEEIREYNEYHARCNFRGRGRGRFNGRFGQNQGRS
ncbi:hypothetical protein PIB30_022647 [Stylosanthes scabra]|uniref:Uncharacterized protein n=1 Tax=Stylosanthes scabra TaxID=79078 RepID=A0ABU6UC05_9FABA|nr:hypothetical protein [Stylosanthes scabra]